jgi:signal transduction histidine kinase
MEFAVVLVPMGLLFLGAAFLAVIQIPGMARQGVTARRNRQTQQLMTQLTQQVALAHTELYQRARQLEDLSRRLELSNRELSRLNNMKSKFLSMVVHDMRTPLMTVQGFSTALAGRADPASAEILGHIHRATGRMAELMADLTDLAVIEAGKLRMEMRPFDLSRTVRELAPGLQLLARRKGVELSIEEMPASLAMTGDGARLAQALQNLLNNAVKFTLPGGRVGVRVRAEASTAWVAVRDTGPGIHASERQMIFEKFYQSAHQKDEALRRQGWGLGLSIAAEIVRAHRGTLGVESAGLGRGSTFYFRVPLQQTGAGRRGSGAGGRMTA